MPGMLPGIVEHGARGGWMALAKWFRNFYLSVKS